MRLDITSNIPNNLMHNRHNKGEQHAWKEGNESNPLMPYSFDFIKEKGVSQSNGQIHKFNAEIRDHPIFKNACHVNATPNSAYASKCFSNSKPGSKRR